MQRDSYRFHIGLLDKLLVLSAPFGEAQPLILCLCFVNLLRMWRTTKNHTQKQKMKKSEATAAAIQKKNVHKNNRTTYTQYICMLDGLAVWMRQMHSSWLWNSRMYSQTQQQLNTLALKTKKFPLTKRSEETSPWSHRTFFETANNQWIIIIKMQYKTRKIMP